MWKLRNKEKKIVKETTTQRIQEMKKKTETIIEILNNEKKKIEEEKKKKEMEEKEGKNAEAKRKERIDKKEKLEEKWAMYRWTVEYLAENTDRWEKERKDREKEKNDIIQEWDRKTRLEKVKTLKEKWRKKDQEQEQVETKEIKEKNQTGWTIWREKERENTNSRVEGGPPQQTKASNEEHQQLYPIFTKLKETKLKMKDINQRSKAKAKRKLLSKQENVSSVRVMQAWLNTSKDAPSVGCQVDDPRDGADGQGLILALQSGDTNYSDAGQSDRGRDCHVNIFKERKGAVRSQPKQTQGESEKD